MERIKAELVGLLWVILPWIVLPLLGAFLSGLLPAMYRGGISY